jgi:anti-sigma B factor antagonist
MVEIKNSQEKDICTIQVIGEVDAASSIHLYESISEATSNHKKILVNLERLDFMSSAGLGVFSSEIENMKTKGITMVLYGMNDRLKSTFQLLGLDLELKITDTEGEAKQIVDGV